MIMRMEGGWLDSNVEAFMVKQLKHAFDVGRVIFIPMNDKATAIKGRTSVEVMDSMEEALESSVGNRVFLEPTGYNNMSNMPDRSENVVFITGSATAHNLDHAELSETYRIHTPKATDMFGMNAAAIALAYWYGQ